VVRCLHPFAEVAVARVGARMLWEYSAGRVAATEKHLCASSTGRHLRTSSDRTIGYSGHWGPAVPHYAHGARPLSPPTSDGTRRSLPAKTGRGNHRPSQASLRPGMRRSRPGSLP
jgi:hypothetical protein